VASVLLDLNQPELQQELFGLVKDQQRAVLNTFQKISAMTWDEVYRDRGLKWEATSSGIGPGGRRLYTFRCGKGFRIVAYRDGTYLVPLSLHPDHDSAYR
jgi:hypothetical protein